MKGLTIILASIAAFSPGPAQAQDSEPKPIGINRPAPTGPRELTFDSLAELFPAGSTKLVNGTEIVDVTAWAAVLIARLDIDSFCTATLIGPKVLLTAAHCIDAGFGDKAAVIGGRVNAAGSQYRLTGCQMHPAYAAADRVALDVPRMSEDFALCELDGTPPIVLETLAGPVAVGSGSQLLMMGYGCTGIRVVANALDFSTVDEQGKEKLRLGDSLIEVTGVADHKTSRGSYLRVRSSNGEPILCPGDSGGPAIVGATVAVQRSPYRRVVGVNSKVDALPRTSGGYDYLSYMSSISNESFENFLKAWIAKAPANRQVCGRQLIPGAKRCRA